MSKYAEQDKELLAMIGAGKSRFHELVNASGLEFRLIDRRLQAMKRAGKLRFSTAIG